MTISRSRGIAGKLDQDTSVQEILQQRFLIFRKLRVVNDSFEKLDRRLTSQWQSVLFGHITAKNIGHANAELVGIHLVDLLGNQFKRFKCALARQLRRLLTP